MIEDGTTNRAFLLALLDRPEFRSGEVDINWLDRLGMSGEMESSHDADAALLQAAIELADEETALERASFYAYARRGRPQSEAQVSPHGRGPPPRPGLPHRRLSARPGRYRCEVDGAALRSMSSASARTSAASRIAGDDAPHADLPPGHRPAGRGPRRAAPHHARRRRLRAQPRPGGRGRHSGQRGRRGGRGRRRRHRRVDEDGDVADRAVRRAACAACCRHQRAGRRRTTPLLQLEPLEDEAAEQTAERVDFERRRRRRGGSAEAALERLRWAAARLRRQRRRGAARAGHAARAGDRRADRGRAPPARRCTPTCARSPAPRHDDPSARCCTARRSTCTRSCARSTRRPSGCPSASSRCSQRALAHYGVESLDRTPALEDACYRLFLSQQRADLGPRRRAGDPRAPPAARRRARGRAGASSASVLDRLEAATEGRDPRRRPRAPAALPHFDAPLIAAAPRRRLRRDGGAPGRAAEDPRRADRDERSPRSSPARSCSRRC